LLLVLVIIAGYTPLVQEAWWKDAMFSEQMVNVIQQIKQKVPVPFKQILPV